MTPYRGHFYRLVRRRAGWFALVFLDGEFRFVTKVPCDTKEQAEAAAREIIETATYDGRGLCLD
jgi:hypothetical protein